MADLRADKTHVFSGSDDATARLWDLSQGEQVLRFDGHTDYVRSVCAVSDVLWLTGSYDHTVKLWDARAGRAAALTLEHGAPVESVTALAAGRMAASAGGTAAALWDLAAAGRPLQRLANHQKTVTSVSAVDVKDAQGARTLRVLTSALDGHVKVRRCFSPARSSTCAVGWSQLRTHQERAASVLALCAVLAHVCLPLPRHISLRLPARITSFRYFVFGPQAFNHC